MIKIICGFALTGLFLTLSQSPFDFSLLAWIAFLPLIFIARPDVKKRWLFLLGYISCLGYWLGNLYWMSIPTMAGYISFCAYMGVYWPLLAICVRYFRGRGWPLTFLFPVLIVGAEAWQGWILGGFSWRLLGHSMHSHLGIIQIADIFGVGGITFLVAAVNGFVAEVSIGKTNQKIFKFIFTACLVGAALFYGKCRLEQIEATSYEGPMVTSVQSNEPLPNFSLNEKSDEIFDYMMLYSGESLIVEPRLIIWPETMVLTTLEQDYLTLLGPAYRGFYFNNIISTFAGYNNVQMVIGATGGITDYNEVRKTVMLKDDTNAAYVYNADGSQNKNRYDKIHLIPFGEYLPFEETVPQIHELLKVFSPYDSFHSLMPGSEYYTYELEDEGEVYKYGIIICYEDTLAGLTRKMAVNKDGAKRVDWLVNISNDGWFTRRNDKDQVTAATTELVQHAIICSFRAVENRVGIVRSVNTGVSCFIESTGRIVNGFEAGSLPKKAFERLGVKGYIADNVKTNDTVTFFSIYGQWVDFICGILVLPLVVLGFRKLD